MLGIGFLLFHRKWKAATLALATVAALEIGLSLAAFGLAGAWHEHVSWWQQGAQGTANRQLTTDSPVDEDRLTNQSVAITLRRLLTSLGTTVMVRDVAADHSPSDLTPGAAVHRELTPGGRIRQRVQIADLTADQLHTAYLVVSALLFLAVAYYCRPETRKGTSLIIAPRREATSGCMGSSGYQSKLVMLTLATLWFSPVTWSYHFVAATPAVAALSAPRPLPLGVGDTGLRRLVRRTLLAGLRYDARRRCAFVDEPLDRPGADSSIRHTVETFKWIGATFFLTRCRASSRIALARSPETKN